MWEKFCGKKKIIKLNLKVPKNIYPKIILNSSKIFSYLPKFDIDANKFDKGHVLVIGGEMSGAFQEWLLLLLEKLVVGFLQLVF